MKIHILFFTYWYLSQVSEWELSVDVSSIAEGGRYDGPAAQEQDAAAAGLEKALARLEALEAQARSRAVSVGDPTPR